MFLHSKSESQRNWENLGVIPAKPSINMCLLCQLLVVCSTSSVVDGAACLLMFCIGFHRSILPFSSNETCQLYSWSMICANMSSNSSTPNIEKHMSSNSNNITIPQGSCNGEFSPTSTIYINTTIFSPDLEDVSPKFIKSPFFEKLNVFWNFKTSASGFVGSPFHARLVQVQRRAQAARGRRDGRRPTGFSTGWERWFLVVKNARCKKLEVN